MLLEKSRIRDFFIVQFPSFISYHLNVNNVLAEVMTPLAEKYQAGELSNEQLVNELIDGVAKRYREPVELLPAKTVPVHVVRNGEKDYEVLMQDEYLLTFAQQS
ncbi:hypothetical protein QJ133_16025 [Priestia megaterium]|jgi:hypothetical protein|uniref:hypothetical protein n=1 Tax=Priestia megaterium TaxID=1404 RepID=UPI00249C8C86|nr:hypothetical protein [Priestia megaterium]MDI3092632.1 hypothetical protein [Priestia megaterium]